MAVDWWKAVFKETKRTLVRRRPWRYGGEEGEGGNGSVVLVSLSRCGVVLAAVPSALFNHDGTTGAAYKARQIAHSLNLSSKTLFPVGYRLSNATQTMVPAPTRPHLLMASSPLRTYDRDLWSLPLWSTNRDPIQPTAQLQADVLAQFGRSVLLYTHFIHISKNAIDRIPRTT